MFRISILLFFALLGFCPRAEAVKTASSFDLNYAVGSLGMKAYDGTTGVLSANRTLTSYSGIEADYNVAIFDYRTVITVSFTQFENSNVGQIPFTRFAVGGSYHFFRINGQRVIMDSQVESKSWGVSPALELTIGMTKLSINDSVSFHPTVSIMDALPRIVIEVPGSHSFLFLFKVGSYMTVSGKNQQYNFQVSGLIMTFGFKLTTL